MIGRALRRQSYELNEHDLFDVEYADVFGIPFDFTAKPVIPPPPKPRETVAIKALRPERDVLEIEFPRVQGYRVELPEDQLEAEFNNDHALTLTPDLVGPSETKNAGIIGEAVDLNLKHLGDVRQSTLVSARRCEGKEVHDGYLLDSRREPSRVAWPLGLRRIRRRV